MSTRWFCECFGRLRRASAARRDQRISVRDLEFLPLARDAPRLICHRDRFAQMGDRLLEGGAAQRLIAGLAPPLDGEIVEVGLSEVMCDRPGLGDALSHRISAARA